MDYKQSMIDELGDAYNEDMSDKDILNAFKAKIKGNAAEQPVKPAGEQAKPEGELEVNAQIEQLIADKVDAAMKANAKAAEQAERDQLNGEITANSKDFTAEDLADMPMGALRKLAANCKPKRNSFGVAGGQVNANQSSLADMQMPE